MKKGLIILGSIVVLIVGYLFWHYTSSADDEIHLLPKGFTGIVIIRFNAKNGKEKSYEDGKRVYKIPANGILDTKFDYNEGVINPPEFYYLEKDKRTPIPSKYKVFSMQGGIADSDITNKGVDFESYLLCEEKDQDSLFTVRERMNVADAK
jgi:hypothetical protein